MELFEKPPINGFALSDTSEFVTVVSVGSLEEPINKTQSTDDLSAGYVTVLTIGDDELNESSEKIEDVLVYRLPGERLGFGLKFEGGTKASEFVKRLFIQSCAADSPASRVRSSWGCLTEGDEVLEIDSVPVKSMTRIDCVRCLKDSNVVIKLLVKHTSISASAKSTEDLPLVIGAEKKRTPPPPPPIPPRKIPRKFGKENATNIVIPPKGFSDGNQEAPVPPARQTQPENNVNGIKNRHQSPRNSGRLLQPRQSPEVVKRDRRLSDGSIGPPDAEVYVDLFSQESPYCLSESDDTGSSISTVVDRFGSFPTTTTSSFAGSLPSTPTSIQKQMDLSNVLNPFDAEEGEFENDYLFSKLVSLQAENVESTEEPPIEKIEKCVPLQPPANFQDAPLSYGDEDVRIVEAAIKTAIEINEMPDENAPQIEVENNAMNGVPKALSSKKVDDIIIVKPGKRRPPPPPPRSKHQPIKEKNNNDYNAKNENSENLPRLVDFVPKSAKIEKYETLKRFLENEQRVSAVETLCENVEGYDVVPNWGDGADFYTFNWSPSSQLATIGEDEEEGLLDIQQQRSPTSSAPIVIVENADEKEEAAKTPKELDVPDGIQERNENEEDVAQSLTKSPEPAARTALRSSAPPDVDVMEAPSINSRQPPDGHEFPDYQEAPIVSKPIMSEVPAQAKMPARTLLGLRKDQKSTNSVRNMIAKFSNNQDSNVPDGEANDALSKKGLSKSVININDTTQSSLKSYNFPITTTPNNNSHSTNRTSLDISTSAHVLPENKFELSHPRLHMRSQSLIDISDKKSNTETDRWSILVEQRRRGLSKLKGLIIPEHSDPVDETIPSIDLPEIKSTATPVPPIADTKPQPSLQIPNHSRNSSTPSFSLSNWNLEPNNTIPKYSPAFKRKTLAVYGTKTESEKSVKNQKPTPTSQVDDESRIPVTSSLSDAPKSLESITSPTRSDCSFEYISSSPELKAAVKISIESRKCEKATEDTGKSEDESDNDSAVSSSQSSYISRNSPPTSPNHLQSHYPSSRLELTSSDQHSVDTLNRRLLKPQSVEAINRKNILASAKCRSGRDLKVGSPLIQRKFEETGAEAAVKPEPEVSKECEEEPKELPPLPPSEEEPIKAPICDKPTTPPVIETNGHVARKFVAKEETKRTPVIRETLDVSRPLLPRSMSRNSRAASVTDLRKNFEKLTQPLVPKTPTISTSAVAKANSRMSLNLSNTAASPPAPVAAKRNSLPNIQAPPPPAKPINNADHQIVLDDTLRQYDETFSKDDLKVIALCPEFLGGSIGITLAGGTDYETKEITVHKVRSGSVAFQDGRLQKGDRILSINGKTMKGITHAESIAILKEPVPEAILVACTWKEPPPSATLTSTSRHNSSFDLTTTSTISPKADAVILPAANNKQEDIVVTLVKDAAGLGFSMEGGKDSPQGDVPLVIKKLFTGGTADKCGKLKVGDELVEINGVDVTTMPRIDTWALMKKLPVGEVILKVRR